MTAIECTTKELNRIQSEMSECVSPEGYVRSSCRYRYQMLIAQARDFQASKTWLEDQRIGA